MATSSNEQNKKQAMQIVPDITDSHYITYGVFYLMGMLVYVPFHIFIHAYLYWNFKFQEPCERDHNHPCPPGHGPGPPDDPKPPDPGPPIGPPHRLMNNFSSPNYRYEMGPPEPPERNGFQMSFSSSFYITSHSTLLAFLVLTIWFSKKMPPPVKRIPGALLAVCLLFATSTILTQIDFGECIQLFFGISILLVIIINFCSAISIISLYELVTRFPVSYYASIMSGQSICGIVAVLIQIALIGAKLPAEINGAIYFALGTAIMLATTVFYLFLMRRSKFFIYTIQDHGGVGKSRKIDDVRSLSRDKMISALRRIKWYYASLVFVQGSTALIHPGFTSLVISMNRITTWSEDYFMPVITYLLFHVCNLIGRESAKVVKTPKNGMVIMVASVIRLALVPLIMFCNAQPRSHMPVYFGDSTFILLIGIIAFSEGILLNVTILAIPSVVPKDEIEAAMVLVPCFSLVTVALCSGLNMVINNLI